MFDIVQTVLGADVASSGTIAFAYPKGRGAGDYALAHAHKLAVPSLGTVFEAPKDFTVAHTTVATVTYNGATTIPKGTVVSLQLDRLGDDANRPADVIMSPRVKRAAVCMLDLGSPVVNDADGIMDGVVADDTVGGHTYDSGDFVGTFNGTLDVPRNITAQGSAGSDHVVTITGKDEYGVTVKESLTLSGTDVIAGKKAFKTVESVHVAAGAAGDTVDIGWANVIGLPVFVPHTGFILGDFEDGVFDASIDGTFVAGVVTKASATTGDVRGTYVPGVTPDGAKAIQLLVVLPDPGNRGVPQFAG